LIIVSYVALKTFVRLVTMSASFVSEGRHSRLLARMARVSVTAALLLLLAAPRGTAHRKLPPNSIFIRAFAYDRGNVKVFAVGEGYADAEAVVINAGAYPNVMEYEIEFPVTAKYTFFSRYAALQSRPVEIYLDGRKVHEGFKSITGSWQSSTAKWVKEFTVEIPKGKHTIKLERKSCIPHIVAFRLDSDKPFPAGWKLERPNANRIQGLVSLDIQEGKEGFEAFVREDGYVVAPPGYNPIMPFKKIPPPLPMAQRVLEFMLIDKDKYPLNVRIERSGDGKWVARLSVKVNEQRTESADLVLRAEDVEKMLKHALALIDDFRSAGRRDFLATERAQAVAMLDELKKAASLEGDSKWKRIYDLHVRAFLLKNRVALSNPLLDFEKLLFVKRQTYNTSHIYTTYFDGSRRPGGNLCVLNGVRPTGKVNIIAGELGDKGIFRDPDLSWDARKVLFSFKAGLRTPCHIYEVGIDGKGLRQITNSEYDDIDPCYLPDGRIVFISTRCRRVVLCHNAFTVSVLYTMNPDGSDIRCISPNTVNEFTPSVTSDGRVIYCRWEYVDKHLGNDQSMWVVNPDGTRAAHITGAHWGPIALWEPRQVPGSHLFVCTLAPHMPIAVGPIALVDPCHTCSSPAKYTNLTPELPPAHHFGWNRKDVGYYCNPFPLSEKYFIVSYTYSEDAREPKGYGIYLLDKWGNRDLIYRDPEISCFEAFPVKPRPKPPVLARAERGREKWGTFHVIDVYRGLPGIERGTVKYIRVIEEVAKPVSARCRGYLLQYPVISNGGDHALKRLLGTVPVEADGSALFRAPADVAVYFSALDENFMEIQRMRSFTYIAAGEVVSCIGCHEHRTTAPPNVPTAALLRAPSEITPPLDGVHAPDFAYDVMPIINKHCARCHGVKEPKGGVDLSADYTDLFNVAYETLTKGGKYVNFVSLRSAETLPLRGPKHYGSHASKLPKVLMTTHKERVKLSKDEFRRIVTWIDCNAPYYGTFRFTRPNTIGGRELVDAELQPPLRKVYAKRCLSCHGKRGDNMIRRIRFPCVERSLTLLAPLARAAGGTEACKTAVFADTNDPDYKTILETFRKVSERVKTNPRVDMLGRQPPMLDPECEYRYR